MSSAFVSHWTNWMPDCPDRNVPPEQRKIGIATSPATDSWTGCSTMTGHGAVLPASPSRTTPSLPGERPLIRKVNEIELPPNVHDELYNLDDDPFEMHKLAQGPAHEERPRTMMARMWRTV